VPGGAEGTITRISTRPRAIKTGRFAIAIRDCTFDVEGPAMIRKHFSRRPGFTPVDVLVVLALLLLALAFLAPAVSRVREAAARTHSTNNLKQMALAVHSHNDTYKLLPPVVGEFARKTGTVHFFMLPFIEQGPLCNSGTNAVWDNDVWSKRVEVYLDPRDASAPPGAVFKGWLATTNYPANAMVFTDGKHNLVTAMPDGTSNTLMIGQRYQMCNGTPTAWAYPSLFTWAPMIAYDNHALFQISPSQDECDPTRAQALGSVLLIAMGDGSARAVNPRLSAQTWYYLCDPADGNPLGPDFQ